MLNQRVNGRLPISRTNRKNRELAGEGDETFQDQRDGGEFGLCFGDVLRGAENPLTFAVVTHARSLENSGKPDRFYGRVKAGGIRNGGEFGGGNAESAKQILFCEAILCGFESGGRRIDRNTPS